MIGCMTYFADKLELYIKEKGISAYRLAKLIGLHEQHMYKIARGERRPTDEILEKIANTSELDITLQRLKSWRLIDDYGYEAVKQAYEEEVGN